MGVRTECAVAIQNHPSLYDCPLVMPAQTFYSLSALEKLNVYLYTRAYIFIQCVVL